MKRRAAALNLSSRLFVDEDGTMGVVELLLDRDGEKTEEDDEAFVAVIALETGKYLNVVLSDFQTYRLH
jgi:hypothetical protein